MKTTLLILGGLCMAGSARAQFGVSAGANYAKLATTTRSQSQTLDTDGKVGYQLGVFYEQKLGGRFSLVPELQLSQQRSTLRVQDYEEGYKTDYQVGLSYLNVPIVLRTAMGKFYLDLGSQIGLLLSAREKGTLDTRSIFDGSTTSGAVSSFNQSAPDGYQRFNYSSSVGLGLRLSAGLAGGVRLTNSWGNVNRGSQPNRYDGSLSNVTIQTSLSYQLAAKP